MFNDVGMPGITELLWPFELLASCKEAGRLWVVTDALGVQAIIDQARDVLEDYTQRKHVTARLA